MEKSADLLFGRVNEIMEKHGYQKSHLIAILQEVQAEYRYLPQPVLAYIANAMGLSGATVYGVATFYGQFSLNPKGKYVLKICDGTACHVRGSQELNYKLTEVLNLAPGQETTDDLLFTVETVSCLGACGLAPVVTVNDEEVYGSLTPEAAALIIEDLLKREKEAAKEEVATHA